jgi:hypothetical protein
LTRSASRLRARSVVQGLIGICRSTTVADIVGRGNVRDAMAVHCSSMSGIRQMDERSRGAISTLGAVRNRLCWAFALSDVLWRARTKESLRRSDTKAEGPTRANCT